ncbi:MAG: hypothetical protein K0R81_695 [Microbacterium sp.]|nr:hypothetical protein [Microbacterium sp.]
MAGFWGRRKREEQDAADADLARRAELAIVAADERVRLTSNHDEIPDTSEELRTRNARIIQLSKWAEDLLEERTLVLQPKIDAVRRAPEILTRVRADRERLAERVPHAREVVERLAHRYNDTALQQIGGNPDEIDQLLDFAVHTAGVSERRREAGQREQASVALEAATEAVRRAESLLDAVDTFEIEALRAESTLAAVIDDSRGDLAEARRGPMTPIVTQAMANLERALASLPPAGSRTDPFSSLSALRQANAELDLARERAARPVPSQEQVEHAIDDADRQLAVARGLITGHRGWIGADARTRFVEAERLRAGLPLGPVAEDDRETVLATARRTGALAAEALQIAQRDIEQSRPSDWGDGGGGGWGGGYGRGGGGGGNMVGGMLGGLVIGSLLGDIFDG